MRQKKKSRGLERNADSGSIIQRTTVKNFVSRNMVIGWKILDFDKLKIGAMYYQMYVGNDFSCVFKLIKARKTLYVAFRCRMTKLPSVFYLANGDESVSSICTPEEIADGLYVGQFPNGLVCSPMGDYVLTGVLTLVFAFVRENRVSQMRDYELGHLGELSDMDDLCSDMRNMFLDGVDSDFTINAGGSSFKVHKYMLMARSEFFRQFFFEDPEHPAEYTINAHAGTVYMALLYCYSGELPELSVNDLMEVLDVAKDMKMFSLMARCHEDIQKNGAWIQKIKDLETLMARLSSN